MGAVTELGSNWATVRLINDTRSVVIGRDTRTRATGEVHGDLAAPLELNKVQFTEDLAVGDLVVTAGIRIGRDARSQFPRDLVIGSIISVDKDPASTTISALVQPAADLDGLELVLVVMDFTPTRCPARPRCPRPSRRRAPKPRVGPSPMRRAGRARRPSPPGGRPLR